MKFVVLLKICTLLLTLFILAGLVHSQNKSSPSLQKSGAAKVSQRSPEIENLISIARTTPPEFAIDALIRIAASDKVDATWKQEILEEAFVLTANVQNPLRLRAIALPATSADTRAYYLSSAFDLRLDRLSLRSRIVNQMSSIDKNRALRMLNQIPSRLLFKEVSCGDWMSYDVSYFYQTLQTISETAFDRKKIQQGERVQFILPYVEGMTSPVQVGPITRLLVGTKLTFKELLILDQAFVSALKKIDGDDRSFSVSLNEDRTVHDVLKLIELFRAEKSSYSELLNAVHDYLGRHLTGVRCQDNASHIRTELPVAIKEANYLFPTHPFLLEDVQPARIEASPKVESYFESKESAELLLALQRLNYDDNDEKIDEETRTTIQWQQRVLDLLRMLETWNGKDTSFDEDVFNQKSVIYLSLISMTPSGTAADQILASYIKLLSQDEALNESRIIWMLHANRLLRLISEKRGAERAGLLQHLNYSKSSVLQLYGELIAARLF